MRRDIVLVFQNDDVMNIPFTKASQEIQEVTGQLNMYLLNGLAPGNTVIKENKIRRYNSDVCTLMLTFMLTLLLQLVLVFIIRELIIDGILPKDFRDLL